MKEIRTEILINSNIEKVWKIFSDFESFKEWNPFIKSIQGKVSVNNKIKILLSPPDVKPIIFKPKVLKFIPSKEVRWIGHMIIPGLFDGEHIFELIDNKNGTTTFIQREKFSGLLVYFTKNMLENNTRRGFMLMNEKLKEKCESS